MRIGIEGLPLLFHRTGTSTYTHELVQNLRRLHKDDTVVLFARNQRGAGDSYHKISYAERALNLFYKEYRLPLELGSERIDIYHSPRDMGLPSPKRVACPCLMTLHDVVLVRLARDYYSRAHARIYESRLRKRLETADHIITVSEFSRNDILDWSGIDPDKVSVVHNGVSGKFGPVTDEAALEEVRRRYGLPRRFILSLGSTEPRKNITRAIQAYSEIRRMEPGTGLVVTGVDYSGVQPRKAFSGLPMEGVNFSGYISDTDMPALISAAEILFFPSLYEGFGLPPLEAMACGTPVVTSNTTSIPEMVGDAAVMVDPADVAGMAAALEMVLNSEDLRAELVKKGFERATRFSWASTAEETKKIYKKVVDGK
ncbi:MAG: glycosyltransferase family 4 protein [Thermoleophilia bacterium]|nr:glycosyltransferase family 4 protein [Thermoleophilia bacterium]